MVSRYVHPWPELFEGDLSALMDELGFDTLASPTHSPVIDPETSSQLFFVSSMEFGMIINLMLCHVSDPILSDPDVA